MVLKKYIDTKLKDSDGNTIPLKRPKGVSVQQWDKALEMYKVAKSQGDKYPELTIAQAALESSWFNRPSASNNFFGQKASKNQKGTVVTTKEVSKNKAYTIKDKFRDYDTLEEALADRVNKWGAKYKDAANVEEALYSIWQYDEEKGRGVGYATDDKYDVKIKKILNMMGVPLSKQSEEPNRQKINIPSEQVQETTKDSLDPNYYMEDIINDSTSAPQSKELIDLQKIFQMETERKAKEKDYLERLKTVSQQPPTQTEENYRQNNLDIEQLYNDSLYNYINIDEY